MDHIDQDLGIHPACWNVLRQLSQIKFNGTKSKHCRTTFHTDTSTISSYGSAFDHTTRYTIQIKVEIVNTKNLVGNRPNCKIEFFKIKNLEVIEVRHSGYDGAKSFNMTPFNMPVSTPNALVEKIKTLINEFIAISTIKHVIET